MSNLIPFPSFTVLINTLSTEYFGATFCVLVMLMAGCGFLIWKRQKSEDGKGVFLYLALLFLMSLLFAVVSIKDDHNNYEPVSVGNHVDYDYVINGNRIDVYERTSN